MKTSALWLNELQIEHVPRHGVITALFGMSDYRLVAVVDFDTEQASVTEQEIDLAGKRPLHHGTIALDHAVVVKLRDAAEKAWREPKVGDDPSVTDVASRLYIIDGDDAFLASTTLFAAQRPAARDLVDAVDKLDTKLRASWRHAR